MNDQLSSRDQLVQFISESVQEHFKKTNFPINGAQLDLAIKVRFPGFSYSQLDLERLGQAVQLAETAGLVVRNWKVKHLELYPPGIPVGDRIGHGRPPTERRDYLRQEVWKALVYYTPWEHRFLKRETAEVIPVPAEQRERYDQDPDYVRIDPVSPTTQKAWMQEFVARRQLPDASEAPIGAEDWWRSFPFWLGSAHGDATLKAWLVYRTQQVLAYAKSWAQENGVAVERLLSGPTFQSARTLSSIPPLPTSDAAAVVTNKTMPDDLTRRAILAAINEMSTEELADLAIPLRYMLRHFKAR